MSPKFEKRLSGRPAVGEEPAPPPPDDSPPDAPIAEALRLRAMGVLARRLPVAMALLDDRDLLRLEDDLDRVLAEGLKAYKIDTRRKRRKDLRKS